MKGRSIVSLLDMGRYRKGSAATNMSIPVKTVSKTEMEAEWALIQEAKRNPAKFRGLYNKYYMPIFRFVMKRTGDEGICADITSQVFLKAMQKLGGYQYKGVPFSAWLYRIASNEVTQYFRKSAKRRVVSVEEHHIADLIDESGEGGGDIERQKEMLVGMLKGLKEGDLQLIELRFFEQRSFKEIAEILDMTESNAKVKTYRIIERMRKKARDF